MECPHCNEMGVSAWSKLMSGPALPAKCKLCGEPSSTSGGILALAGALIHVIAIVAAVMSFYYWSWWPIIFLFGIYVLFQICLVRWVPLKALSDKQVANNKMFVWVFISILALLAIIAGLADW